MDWLSAFDERQFSVGIAPAADITDQPLSNTYVFYPGCEMPQVSVTATSADGDYTVGQYGAGTAPYVGGMEYQIQIRQRVHGQLSNYAGTSPQFEDLMKFVPMQISPLAARTSDLDFGASAEQVTNSVSNDLQGYAGSLLAADFGIGESAAGFIKAAAGTSVTLMEPAPVGSVSGVDRLASNTYGVSRPASTAYQAIRVSGVDLQACVTYYGCVYLSLALEFADDGLWATHTWVSYGGVTHGTDGELQPSIDILDLGSNTGSARRFFAAPQLGLDTGNANPTGVCAVRDIQLTIEWPHLVSRSPRSGSSPEGVCGVVQRSPRLTGQLSIAALVDLHSSPNTETILSKAYRERTPLPLSLYESAGLGRIWALSAPGLRLTAPPTWTWVDGIGFWQCDVMAGDAPGYHAFSIGVA